MGVYASKLQCFNCCDPGNPMQRPSYQHNIGGMQMKFCNASCAQAFKYTHVREMVRRGIPIEYAGEFGTLSVDDLNILHIKDRSEQELFRTHISQTSGVRLSGNFVLITCRGNGIKRVNLGRRIREDLVKLLNVIRQLANQCGHDSDDENAELPLSSRTDPCLIMPKE